MITYLVLDLKKKKFQVGSTVSEETGRPYVHFTDACPNPVLRNATRKRPQDFFVFISEDDGLDTREAEQESLDFYFGTKWCYNLSPHASGGWGHLHAEKDERGKSLHSVKLNEELHREKDEQGRSLHAMRSHIEKDEQGRSIHALKSLGKVHDEKDEQGRSIHALKSLGKVHDEKDEQGRSLHSINTLGQFFTNPEHQRVAAEKSHEEKDEWGRSKHAVSAFRKNSKSVFFTCVETGEVKGPFPSMRVAERETGEIRKTIKRYLDTGKPLNGYLITSE